MKHFLLVGLLLFFVLGLVASSLSLPSQIHSADASRKIQWKEKRADPSVDINAGEISFHNGAYLFINGGSLNINTPHGCSSESTASCPASTNTNFYGPEGSSDAVTINPSSNMGSTTVRNYSGTQHPDGPNSLDHYWEIDATTDATCVLDFRLRDGDIPSGVTLSDLRPWEWNGSTWTMLTSTYSSSSSTGGFTTISFTGVDLTGAKSNNIITLNEYNEDPLPVSLSTFTAVYYHGNGFLKWITESEFNNAGWNIYRSISENFGQSVKVNAAIIEGAGTVSEPQEYTFEDPDQLELGFSYSYWLESVDYAGVTNLHGPIGLDIPEQDNHEAPETPTFFGLAQNYPNPFNPSTEILFRMKEEGNVKISIYNVKGEKVITLFDGFVPAKSLQKVMWDGTSQNGKPSASGVYFYRLESTEQTEIKKMLLIK